MLTARFCKSVHKLLNDKVFWLSKQWPTRYRWSSEAHDENRWQSLTVAYVFPRDSSNYFSWQD